MSKPRPQGEQFGFAFANEPSGIHDDKTKRRVDNPERRAGDRARRRGGLLAEEPAGVEAPKKQHAK